VVLNTKTPLPSIDHTEQHDQEEQTMIHIHPPRAEGLRCAATACAGSPWTATGWHHVTGHEPARATNDFPTVSVFVCTKHLAAAEQAMTHHMATTAKTPWRVAVYRMTGWDDDGRGAAYQVAQGAGATTPQGTLF
jgi:hypothetical protein